MRQRRIFKPARSESRLGRAVLVGIAALVGAVLVGIGLPSDLLGSAPRNAEWNSPASEIRILDGDTLRLGERTLRLHGIAAPERGQSCTDAGGRLYDCGTAATAELARLVQERAVDCRVQGRDRFGRALGLCQAGGAELNASMVANGWALADAATLPALVPLEAQARAAQRGLWSGGFEPPAHWRR
ncbi:thermonuclease family protein [Sabulicella glaciei]|uniref:Thermonuclease family protein n=1 Tax=Sabulicella glaciei TaxID=2984948 RepID=A0ABT3NRH8_9PROT|nr:thermonuclease family protein [Roseococcus sp. MDT2-1-1]MCW8084762.1 thermonuclease family protein [Roseococcus sp. MDT2-1-1]